MSTENQDIAQFDLDSSWISYAEWYNGTLTVYFKKGGSFRYTVSAQVARDFKNAPSPGVFLNSELK
jgi:hypothetical protein